MIHDLDIELIEKSKKKTRMASVIIITYFSIALVVYIALQVGVSVALYHSDQGIKECLGFAIVSIFVLVGGYYSTRGLFSMCRTEKNRLDIKFFHTVTVWLAVLIGALFLLGGLVLLKNAYFQLGDAVLVPFLLFFLAGESPFLVVAGVGFFAGRFIKNL